MPWSPRARKVRLRLLGTLVLLLGVGSAVILGFRGWRAADPADNPAAARYYRQEARQTEIMYGSMGSLANDIRDGLKRPGTQALLIGGFSVLVALGCFFFARVAEAEEAQER